MGCVRNARKRTQKWAGYWARKEIKMRKLCLTVVLAVITTLVVCCPVTFAQENERIKDVLVRAERGDALMQYVLGKMYYDGNNVEQNYESAAFWFEKAARSNLNAKFMLGMMYHDGKGVHQSYNRALRWYTDAADQGHIYAQFTLGVMYYNAVGVARDYAKALYYYELSAEQGDVDGQLALGHMYDVGFGTEKDHVKAVMWYTIAQRSGNRLAGEVLREIEAEVDAKTLADGRALARAWLDSRQEMSSRW